MLSKEVYRKLQIEGKRMHLELGKVLVVMQ